jgi:hypothetical protein
MHIDNQEDLVGSFSPLKIRDDVARNAWIIYKDDIKSKGMTRGQFLDDFKVLPSLEACGRNSYAIHASYSKNDKLMVKNLKTGKYEFGKYDFMPPQVLHESIKLSDEDRRLLISTHDPNERRKKEYGLKAAVLRDIADKIGIPYDIPKYRGKFEVNERVYKTVGGGEQPLTVAFDNQCRAGANIPNMQVWRDDELLEVSWRGPGVKGDYDGMSLAEAKAEVTRKYGKGVEIALKATATANRDTNRTMGTAQLDSYDGGDGAEKRWLAQIGKKPERSKHFSHLTAVFTSSEESLNGTNIDVNWLRENSPDHPLLKDLAEGQLGFHLRVITSGNTRSDIYSAMKHSPDDVKELLDAAGLPRSLTIERNGDSNCVKTIGNSLPAVSGKDAGHRDGPLKAGVDVKSCLPDELMIACRNKNGERTGKQMTLSEYAKRNELLPQDAADILKVDADVYSKVANRRTAEPYAERSRDAGRLGGF